MISLFEPALLKTEANETTNLKDLSLMPSKIFDSFWIGVRNLSFSRPDRNLIGKWMVFISAADLDKAWEKVYHLTVQGKLGFGSKACTARPNPTAQDENIKVIIIYTSDYNDLFELARVAWTLFKENVFQHGNLTYKTDEATRQGLYDHLESKPVCMYSIPFAKFQSCTYHWELVDILRLQKTHEKKN